MMKQDFYIMNNVIEDMLMSKNIINNLIYKVVIYEK